MPSPFHPLARRIHSHLHDHLLPFWSGPALDHEKGGWLPWLSNQLEVDRTQPRGLIVNARILWAFSAAHRADPRPLYRQMAERAFDVVFNRFWDPVHGGAFWRLDNDWNVLEDSKKTYGQAFYLYALSEYHHAFGSPAALERTTTLVDLLESHAHDPRHGGYFEVRQRNWTEALDVRLSDKDMNEQKSMNNHLHVLEAYTALYRIHPDPRLASRLRELLRLFEHQILDPATSHLHHFFDEHWCVKSDSYTYGHDIEASWLLSEAASTLGDAALTRRTEDLAVRLADAVLKEALLPDGGIAYEGREGVAIDRRRECWPQAEALVGFLSAWDLTRDFRYFEAAHGVWKFIENHLADPLHGEWFWRINEDGSPDPSLPKASEWKGPYHGTRACLEASRRLLGAHHDARPT